MTAEIYCTPVCVLWPLRATNPRSSGIFPSQEPMCTPTEKARYKGVTSSFKQGTCSADWWTPAVCSPPCPPGSGGVSQALPAPPAAEPLPLPCSVSNKEAASANQCSVLWRITGFVPSHKRFQYEQSRNSSALSILELHPTGPAEECITAGAIRASILGSLELSPSRIRKDSCRGRTAANDGDAPLATAQHPPTPAVTGFRTQCLGLTKSDQVPRAENPISYCPCFIICIARDPDRFQLSPVSSK